MKPSMPVKPIILIAEDDESNLLYLKAILNKQNVAIISAVNGKEAVDKCREHPEISLVLMDIKMPVMDGMMATREIKLFRQNLPIIALTAFDMNNNNIRIMEAGFDDYLSKPASKDLLTEKLRKFALITGLKMNADE